MNAQLAQLPSASTAPASIRLQAKLAEKSRAAAFTECKQMKKEEEKAKYSRKKLKNS